MKKYIGVGVGVLVAVLVSIGIGSMGERVDTSSDDKDVVAKLKEPVTLQVAAYEKDDVTIEVLPRVELLSGVLSQTTWVETRGPEGQGNAYYRELKAFFEPYKEHEAVKIAQGLTNSGFTYDAPVAFALNLGELPQLTAPEGYSDYLKRRAYGEGNLEAFRIALLDLAETSNFVEDFYIPNYTRYESLINDITVRLDAAGNVNWLEDFFIESDDRFAVVLAPAMFPGGGYGATVDLADGNHVIYEVIRENGKSEDKPEFSASVNDLTLHEWGHAFVNPSMESALKNRSNTTLKRLYNQVNQKMERQAYGSLENFMNEQVLRSVTALYTLNEKGEEAYREALAYEESRGFYLTDYTVQKLKLYNENRETYKTFDAFTPELVRFYEEDVEDLLKLAQN